MFLLGAAVAVVVIMAAGLRPAFQTARVRRRSDDSSTDSSRIVETLSRSGAPAVALIGVERAVQRGRGSSAVPVASAIVGVMLAVDRAYGDVCVRLELGSLDIDPLPVRSALRCMVQREQQAKYDGGQSDTEGASRQRADDQRDGRYWL